MQYFILTGYWFSSHISQNHPTSNVKLVLTLFCLKYKNHGTSHVFHDSKPRIFIVLEPALALKPSGFFLSISSAITSVQLQNLSISSVITSVHDRFSIHQLARPSVQPKKIINQFCGYISSGRKYINQFIIYDTLTTLSLKIELII